MSSTQMTPEVTWAQRSSDSDPTKNYIYLTIVTPDVSKDSMKLDLKSTGLTYTGYSDTKKTNYHLELEFYAEVDVDNSTTHHNARDVELVLRKKELKEEYWPRLLKDSKKIHFLKTNFDKWVDEDEQDGAPDEDAGAAGAGGMPGMGGMGGEDGGFGGIDFSKLGAGGGGMGGMPGMEGLQGMGGMPGMEALQGMGGMGGMGGGMPDLGAMGGDDAEDEDDMPDLEDEGASKDESGASTTKPSGAEDATDAGKGGAKIQEVS